MGTDKQTEKTNMLFRAISWVLMLVTTLSMAGCGRYIEKLNKDLDAAGWERVDDSPKPPPPKPRR